MICNGLKNAAIFIVFIMLVSGCAMTRAATANRDYEITKPITPEEFYVMSVKACKRVGLGSYSFGSSSSVEVHCSGNYLLHALITTNKDRKTVKSTEFSVTDYMGSDNKPEELADNYLKALKAMVEEY